MYVFTVTMTGINLLRLSDDAYSYSVLSTYYSVLADNLKPRLVMISFLGFWKCGALTCHCQLERITDFPFPPSPCIFSNRIECSQAQAPIQMPVKSRRKLVGHHLLYAISVFASLGVFLVGLIYEIHPLHVHVFWQVFFTVRIWSRACNLLTPACQLKPQLKHAVWCLESLLVHILSASSNLQVLLKLGAL